MRITVIGAGNVGATLGRRFSEVGHEVTFGVRDPSGERATAAVERADASSDTVVSAVDGADVVVLAVPATAVPNVAEKLGTVEGLKIIDATNLVGTGAGLPFTSSAAYLAEQLPGVSVAKAFNTVGFEVMADPRFGDRRAVLFVAGEDRARTIAMQLGTDIGFDVLDVGGPESVYLVEAQAITWIRLMMKGAGRGFAFGRLTR